jgi:L-histidine Nalpha-methyltransferase / hercynylcysteine S-oxide synthase
MEYPLTPHIVDVRIRAESAPSMAHLVRQGLAARDIKSLPTMLLYNERGLRLYDDITTEAPEYYLFGAEEDILRNFADEIVSAMHQRTGGRVRSEEVVIELGAG